MPGVPLYDGHGVLYPEVDGGGGGLVVVVLGRAALVLAAVLQTGQSQPQLRHPDSIVLVNLGQRGGVSSSRHGLCVIMCIYVCSYVDVCV